jgi:hypothetical protein
MVLRLSFTLDPDLLDRIETFAKKQELGRNEAVLRLLETGLFQAEQRGEMPPAPRRNFREIARVQKNMDLLLHTVDELKKEIRTMHHLMDLRDRKEQQQKKTGQKVRKWWQR